MNQVSQQKKNQNNSILTTNSFFKQARKHSLKSVLCYSDILKLHYLVVEKPKYGMVFENGIFISLERFQRDIYNKTLIETESGFEWKSNSDSEPLTGKILEAYVAGLGVFRDEGYRILGENK